MSKARKRKDDQLVSTPTTGLEDFFFKVALAEQAHCLLWHGSEEVNGDQGLIIYYRWPPGSTALIES